MLNKNMESHTFKMKNALVGKLNQLDYYRQDGRLAYFSDYDSIKIVPILHRNCINFFGIKHKDLYVCFAKLQDKFITLDYNNVLTTYQMATGKVISSFKLK